MSSSPKVVKSAAPAKVKLSLYQTGNAVITEERQPVGLAAGKQLVQFDGMPTTYQQGSLVVLGRNGKGKVKLGPIAYRKPNLSNENILKRSVGSAITVIDGDRRITGVVDLVAGNAFYLKEANGTVHVLSTGARVELSQGLPDGLSSYASLCLEPEAEGDGASFGMKVLYDAAGIQWSNVRYAAVYDRKAKRFKTMACLVEVTNNCGADFDNAVIKLLTGHNRGRQRDDGMRGIRPQMAAMSMKGGGFESALESVACDEAEAGKIGDHDYYTVPGENSLANGEVKEFWLLSREDVPVTDEYYLPAGYYQQAANAKDLPKQGLTIKLRVQNTEANNLGKALPPSGQFEVLQADEKGDEQKTDWASIRSVAVGEEFSFDLNNPSQDVKATRQLTYLQEDPREPEEEETEEVGVSGFEKAGQGKKKKKKDKKPRYHTETRETTVYNFKKDEAVEVLVYEQIPQEAEILENSHTFADQKVNSAYYRVKVPAAGQVTIKYTAKWRVE
jgi:hypothetical protein